MGGSIYILRPNAAEAMRTLLTTPAASTDAGTAAADTPAAPTATHPLFGQLVRGGVIQLDRADGGRREKLRSALARRVLGCVLAAADRTACSAVGGGWRLLHAARWGIAVFGWAETVRAWESRYPQPAPAADNRDELLDAVDQTVRRTAARSFVSHRCKERALACLALARRNGVRAELVVGLAEFPIAAHVWVECGDRILSDDPENCRSFRPVARFTGRGIDGSA